MLMNKEFQLSSLSLTSWKTSREEETISRQERSLADDSQQKSTLTASEVQVLIKQELDLLQNQVCAKDHTLCRTGPKGNTGRRGRPGTRGRPGPQEDPDQADLLVNMNQ
ncbi:hypothetical protein ACROYT_G012180 [Oculina patagonica]